MGTKGTIKIAKIILSIAKQVTEELNFCEIIV